MLKRSLTDYFMSGFLALRSKAAAQCGMSFYRLRRIPVEHSFFTLPSEALQGDVPPKVVVAVDFCIVRSCAKQVSEHLAPAASHTGRAQNCVGTRCPRH